MTPRRVGRALESTICQELPELGPLARIRAGGNESSMTALQMRREIAEIRRFDPGLVTRTYDIGSGVSSLTGGVAGGQLVGHNVMSETGSTIDEVKERPGLHWVRHLPSSPGFQPYLDVKAKVDSTLTARP